MSHRFVKIHEYLGKAYEQNNLKYICSAVAVLMDELQELRDNQESSQSQEFDWSQAKPGMAFWYKGETLVNFACLDPVDSEAIIAFDEINDVTECEKEALIRTPKHDVDWSHIENE